jgi:hypothetical protein
MRRLCGARTRAHAQNLHGALALDFPSDSLISPPVLD